MTIANPAEELVEIVDRDNHVIGAVTRRIMRQQGLIHRATYILVFNDRGELYIQKRTITKDIYPGYWDVAAGGVVMRGRPPHGDRLRRPLRSLDQKLCFHFWNK